MEYVQFWRDNECSITAIFELSLRPYIPRNLTSLICAYLTTEEFAYLLHLALCTVAQKLCLYLNDIPLSNKSNQIKSNQGSHPFYSLFIKALLFQLSYETVPWYRMSGGLFVSSWFLPLRVWSFDNCCLMVICYIVYNYETIAYF